jgi:hypothetical protein
MEDTGGVVGVSGVVCCRSDDFSTRTSHRLREVRVEGWVQLERLQAG